jgi:CRISPR-associated protein Cmr4
MFIAKKPMFIYAISPVHMGAGTTLGVIDNPIQRERHTDHPVMAGSGIKGALRYAANKNGLKDDVIAIFGPEPRPGESDKHAGAVSFTDGQIVLFPIRSLKEGFVYATCPIALSRLARILDAAGVNHKIKHLRVDTGKCVTVGDDIDDILDNGALILEAYEYTNESSGRDELMSSAKWLAEHALPAGDAYKFFREKIENHTVLLNDGEFAFFVKNATVVEPHVRIDDNTGTAEGGGLFFTENLPPETLMVSLMMASDERKKEVKLKAGGIVDKVCSAFDGELLQIGGDATTGRGQVMLRFAANGGEK